MIKYCKSCGKEYKGDWCEHCGFGKPDLEIKAFDKYKVNKPERFMTEEEKAQRAEEYKKQAKESSKNKTSAKPLQKPAKGSQWGFIILVAVVFAAIVIFMLWQNGIIFHKDKTEVITTYFNSIQTNDFEGIVVTTKGKVKSFDLGTLTKGGKGEPTVTREITYCKITIGGTNVLELDKYNMIWKLNGVDRLQKVRSQI